MNIFLLKVAWLYNDLVLNICDLLLSSVIRFVPLLKLLLLLSLLKDLLRLG